MGEREKEVDKVAGREVEGRPKALTKKAFRANG